VCVCECVCVCVLLCLSVCYMLKFKLIVISFIIKQLIIDINLSTYMLVLTFY